MKPDVRSSREPHGVPRRPRVHQGVLLAAFLIGVAAVVAAVYWPALSARALWLDDEQYLTDNLLVQAPGWSTAGRFLAEVFEPSTVRGYYQPLAMISLMLDYATGGRPDHLRPFRRTSLCLHVLNAGLVVVLLYMLFRHSLAAALCGLLYGIHPLTIESVVWLAERKTLLAAFFAMCCLVLYTRHARKPRGGTYAACLALYVLSLMSKPTTTPLPVLMLLIDYWPIRRVSKGAFLEKIPFFVIGVASAVVTVVSQAQTAGAILPSEYPATRIPLIVCHNIIFYLHKILLPLHVSWFYPVPEPLSVARPAVLVGVIGTLVLIAALIYSLRWTRALLAGWLFFFVAIFPTLGVIGFTVVVAANRFAYFPVVGLLLPLAALLARLWAGTSRARRQSAKQAAAVAVMLVASGACAAATRHYLMYWQDTERLARYSLALAPRAAYVHHQLGNALRAQGRIEEAIDSFRAAARLLPTYATAHNNLGNLLLARGRTGEAIMHLREAVRLDPGYAQAHNNLGVALAEQGKIGEALEEYAKALGIRPGYANAHANQAVALVRIGRLNEAVAHWQEALRLAPGDAELCNRMARAWAERGDLDRALTYYTRGLRIDPHNAAALAGRAYVLALTGRTNEAINEYEEALRIKPDDVAVWTDLGALFAQRGELDKAIMHFNKALELDPTWAKARNNLGTALAMGGRVDEAVRQFRAALESDPRFVEARLNLGRALLQRGDLQQAVAAFRQAALIEPENAAAHFSLAFALEQQGNMEAAVEEYREVLRLDPAHNQARSRLRAITEAPGDSR